MTRVFYFIRLLGVLMSLHAVVALNCNKDNCLRALGGHDAASFCSAFLSHKTITSDLPSYITPYPSSQISSGCSCLLPTSGQISSTTSRLSTARSTSRSSVTMIPTISKSTTRTSTSSKPYTTLKTTTSSKTVSTSKTSTTSKTSSSSELSTVMKVPSTLKTTSTSQTSTTSTTAPTSTKSTKMVAYIVGWCSFAGGSGVAISTSAITSGACFRFSVDSYGVWELPDADCVFTTYNDIACAPNTVDEVYQLPKGNSPICIDGGAYDGGLHIERSGSYVCK